MFSAAGIIIYKAFAPTLKMALVIGAGFFITKKGIFPPQCAKGVSVLSMNIALPCLIFSSMVAAFTQDNISAFGPLAMCAILYLAIGAMLGWVVREIFYVPQDFRWGILVMGMVSNWGQLPTAIVQVLALAAPFNPAIDVQLGVAYIAIFILIMNTVFFACGTHKVCAWDFREDQMDVKPLPFKERWAVRFATVKGWFGRQRDQAEAPMAIEEGSPTQTNGVPLVALSSPLSYEEQTTDSDSHHGERDEEPSNLYSKPKFTGGAMPTRKTSRTPSFSSMMDTTKRIHPTEPLDATDIAHVPMYPVVSVISNDPNIRPSILPLSTANGQIYSYHEAKTPTPSIHTKGLSRIKNILHDFIKNFFTTPASVAVVISLPCALIQPLKALFLTVEGLSGTTIPYGPDGKAPLAFILDTASFVGAVTVPTGLILLGASFARLKLPKRWKDLPLPAIGAMAVCKMILMPIFGIFFVQTLSKHTTLFPPSDKIRIFVAILLSGTPAAANQLVITQLYNPAGSAHTLASFLLLQYMLMFVLSTALAGIALYIVS